MRNELFNKIGNKIRNRLNKLDAYFPSFLFSKNIKSFNVDFANQVQTKREKLRGKRTEIE